MSNLRITDLTSYSNVDPVNDLIEIVDKTNNQNKSISRNNLLGLASAPVGLTDSQTLTNKVLTAPTIASPILSGTITGTYTLAGTPTFPAAVVTLTGSQTLTNKILTSPTINSPTITNASITQDAVTGFTSANNGTVYGVSVTAGVITSAAVGTSSIVTGIQLPDKMKNPYKFSVYRNAGQNTGSGVFAVVNFDTKLYDTGSNVDIITNKGRFTAPIAGFYHFDAMVSTASAPTTFATSIYKNGTEFSRGAKGTGTGASVGTTVSDTLQLAANDYVEIYVFSSSAVAIEVGANPHPYFSGFLVSAT